MGPPESYNKLSLPDIRLSHHPASSATVTPIVLVILDRPHAHNAFTGDMCESLVKAFTLLSADARVKCIILTGSDPANRTFCAGADLTIGFKTGSSTRDTHDDGGGMVSLAIYRCNKPVIVAMNGSAVGVGMTMTLPANIRIVSRDAKVGFVFARRAIAMEASSSFFLPRLIGMSRALHLTTTGEVVKPDNKLIEGLFSEIVPPDEVLPTALRIAEDVAANTSSVATKVMKDLMYRNPGTAEETHWVDSKILFDMFNGDDVREGVQSFMEKRKPRFHSEDFPSIYPWWDTKALEKWKL